MSDPIKVAAEGAGRDRLRDDEDRDFGTEYPRLKGRCPACGNDTLFRGSKGYIVCSWLKCSNPGAAHDLLKNDLRAGVVGPPPVEGRWQPIETAPKDCTDFLWHSHGVCAVIRWPEYEACFSEGEWMPLPPLPQAEPLAGAGVRAVPVEGEKERQNEV